MIPSATPKFIFKYGTMIVPNELVFYEKRSLYAMVPLALKLKQHVMIVPKRNVRNIKDLLAEEIAEFGISIKFLSKILENFYGGTSSTVYIKNYLSNEMDSNHMCAHVIARKKGDLEHNDEIYAILSKHQKEFFEEYGSLVNDDQDQKQSKIRNLVLIAKNYKNVLIEHRNLK